MKNNLSKNKKIKVYHFHNGSGGGVLSVIRNLIRFSNNNLIENHLIYVIDKDVWPQYTTLKIEGCQTESIFFYSKKWNFYYLCKQLEKFLVDQKAVIIAHDWLELGMVSCLGLSNPVIQFLHGDFNYYYQLAIKHRKYINSFICVSPVIEERLKELLPEKKTDIYYKRFPIQNVNFEKRKKNDVLHCVFLVREITDERKQFRLLPKINKGLIEKGVKVKWIIIGNGKIEEVKCLWDGCFENVDFKGELSNELAIEQLGYCDVFVLPSLNEGFPVTLVEAMKSGLVPLITNWGGAVNELVIQGKTGFSFETGDVEEYVNILSQLNFNRESLSIISSAARERAMELFDPIVNIQNIEQIFMQAANDKLLNNKAEKIYGSRLDQKWIPNFVTNFIRSIK